MKDEFLNKSKIEEGVGFMRFDDSVLAAAEEYEDFKPLDTGVSFLDTALLGGLEEGNFYLFLGPAKSGKSTFLRAAAFAIAKRQPVLYVNFEQLHRNFTAKMYDMYFQSNFREMVSTDISSVHNTLKDVPSDDLYLARWTDNLEEKSFNKTVRDPLQATINEIERKHGRKPVVIMENLTDIYNDRDGKGDSLVNVVGSTALEIKNFCVQNELAMLLAHHTAKIHGDRPSLDDVRDSKRVVDLAHSIFCLFTREVCDKDSGKVQERSHHIAYLAGRGQESYWQAQIMLKDKMEMEFVL